MYLEYWGLKKKPFEKNPDPEFIYASHEFEEALARLRYTVKRNKGAALLTGQKGCGKSVVLATLADKLRRESDVALIFGRALKPTEFLLQVSHQLRLDIEPGLSKADLLHLLQTKVTGNEREKKATLLLVDGAGELPEETLEEIRLILNFQSESRFLITVVLAGGPELHDRVRNMRYLDERISLRFRMRPMDFEDTVGYITSRLRASGAERRLFTFEALIEVHGITTGIPMAINSVCDRCLEDGFKAGVRVIGADIVQNTEKAFLT